MPIQRMEDVGIVVDHLAAAPAFFVDLGLELQGEGMVEGGWVDRVVGLEGVRAEVAMTVSGSATSAARRGSSSCWPSRSADGPVRRRPPTKQRDPTSVRQEDRSPGSAIHHVWYFRRVVKTTIYMPEDLHRELKQAAKERGISEAELIRTAVRHELLGTPPGQEERAQRRARLLAAMGTFDSSVYPSGYLDELRAGWRG